MGNQRQQQLVKWYCVRRNLTEDEVRFYAAEITLGLEFLHSKGYVYKDLKAANVLVAASGHIKLTDFEDFGPAGFQRGAGGLEKERKATQPVSSSSTLEASTAKSSKVHNGSPLHEKSDLLEAPFTARTPQTSAAVHQRWSSLSQGPVFEGVASPGHWDKGTPPRHESCNRTPSSSICAPTPRGGGISRKSSSGFPKLFRRRQHNLDLGTTTQRPPGLGARMLDKFMRGRGSASAGSISCTELSSLEGSAKVIRPNVSLREGGQKPGLPPRGPEGVIPQDRSRSPPSDQTSQPVTQQTSVTLAESSWGVTSGSPEYMAPEVLMHDPQGSAVDWWGMGILAYELLVGRTPFAGEGGKIRYTYLNIMNMEVQFPENGEREEGDLSQECKDFVQALLSKDPRSRAGSRGAHVVKAHPFFSSVSWAQLLEQEAPLVPHRLRAKCCIRPPSVQNTSGWWWDVEDVIAKEEEARLARGQREHDVNLLGREDAWWPFDRFNWSDRSADWGRSVGAGSEFKGRNGACARQGEVSFASNGVAAATARAFEAWVKNGF